MKRTLAAIAISLAFAAPAHAGRAFEPSVSFNCKISPDTSKSFIERMFTDCGWGVRLTYSKVEEHNTTNNYNYESGTTDTPVGDPKPVVRPPFPVWPSTTNDPVNSGR